MKTTIEVPDELLKAAKATAAQQGLSLKELFSAALREHLHRSEEVPPGEEAWRRVFGKAKSSDVRAVDRAVAEDLEQVDPESWR